MQSDCWIKDNGMKRFIALARVSSREQEREGFSLEVQEDAYREYARKHRGEIVRMFRIAETATKSEERKTFHELVAFAKKNHHSLHGILFYKVDRAARNLKDFVNLEELETDFGIEFISITQPTQNTPAGRMMRRQLVTIAAYQTEQQSVDVREGIARRVKNGLPPSRAPFGYTNVRRNGRSIVEVHPENGPKVQEVFRLYAYRGLSVEVMREHLFDNGVLYVPSKPKFSITKLYAILHDRHYLGEIKHHSKWLPGVHKPLIDKSTWNRVQVILGKKLYRSHDMLYAGEIITCGHCGRPVSGETKEKQTSSGIKRYSYYRCARYNVGDHPRVRVKQSALDDQVLAHFDDMHAQCDSLRSWFIAVLRERMKGGQRESEQKLSELRRQLSRISNQQDELLELRISAKIDDDRFESKRSDLQNREAQLTTQIDGRLLDESHNIERAAQAADVFRLISERWPSADFAVKRRILEIVFSGFTLDGETLVPNKRTPFELLIAG